MVLEGTVVPTDPADVLCVEDDGAEAAMVLAVVFVVLAVVTTVLAVLAFPVFDALADSTVEVPAELWDAVGAILLGRSEERWIMGLVWYTHGEVAVATDAREVDVRGALLGGEARVLEVAATEVVSGG